MNHRKTKYVLLIKDYLNSPAFKADQNIIKLGIVAILLLGIISSGLIYIAKIVWDLVA